MGLYGFTVCWTGEGNPARESQSKPGIKQNDPEACKEFKRRQPHLFVWDWALLGEPYGSLTYGPKLEVKRLGFPLREWGWASQVQSDKEEYDFLPPMPMTKSGLLHTVHSFSMPLVLRMVTGFQGRLKHIVRHAQPHTGLSQNTGTFPEGRHIHTA